MACECRKLNAENREPGVIIMCDACVRFEIEKLDRHCNDGRHGYVCDKCGSASWEPQGSTTCAACLEVR